MAKQFGGKRPQNLRHTLRRFGDYLGRHKIMLAVVGTLAAVSALAALLGTYMIRPVVNGVLENGSVSYLAGVVALTAVIYIVGALSTLGYTQLMVRAAQKILQDIRRDLFAHLQTLPLHYFDANRKGDLMSLFTNDVDTISDALNNSFAVVIQTLHSGRGHAGFVVCAQLAALAADRCGVCGDVLATSTTRQSAAASTTPASSRALASWTPTWRR